MRKMEGLEYQIDNDHYVNSLVNVYEMVRRLFQEANNPPNPEEPQDIIDHFERLTALLDDTPVSATIDGNEMTITEFYIERYCTQIEGTDPPKYEARGYIGGCQKSSWNK